MQVQNLLREVAGELPEELTEELLAGQRFRIERIVSRGHRSPDGFWYDQEEHEWVLLLAGAGRLRFEPRPEPVELRPGDSLLIAAGERHRVEWTDPEQDTVWLAIFFSPAERQLPPGVPSTGEANGAGQPLE
jgi:cupin 2 domain-containing protein